MTKDGGGEEKKKRPTKLILIAVSVIVLAGGGVAGWLLLGEKAPPTESADTGVQPGAEVAAGQIFSMDTFVVNLNDTGGKRYLKTKIDLEYMGVELTDELKQRLPQVRDVILLLLSSKSLDDIQGVEGKIILRRELVARINQILKKGKIRNIYFTQFVIQ